MNQDILEKLRAITPEERQLLKGAGGINTSIYSNNNSSVIDAALLLEQGKLIDLRPHTRFAHFPKHSHNYVEMVYMLSGFTRHKVNGNEVILRQGELLLMNQHATQEIFPARENDIAVNIMILPQFFDNVLMMLGTENSMIRDFIIDCLKSTSGHVDYLHFQIADILPIQNLMENLIYSLLYPVENQRLLTQTTVGLLFMHLLQNTENLTIGGDRFEDEVMMKVLSLIEEHYKDGELSDICQELDTDLYTISRIIKRRTGRTYTDLLQEKRINYAAYLLTHTELPITDISADVGYNNFSYFYKIFKKEFGITPKEYRNQNKILQ
ncbi:AraC family transcriptional regulator [Pseudobutyrivibrio sp.]|uniref:AraC family transcriptional regulator n=1 Tax=Pseudobutyrivibrio sp. TaxID=2014367 RepID=UPI001D1DA665|nr:AraC family transcriptional regulator [Pseudobutyrivibrio sp.]MBE5911112.1 helix-turn-helix domain-containing protein [Pseudobutyrivibrio sp.]